MVVLVMMWSNMNSLKKVFNYVYGCAGSQLQHSGSQSSLRHVGIFICCKRVGSSSLAREGSQARCVRSSESERWTTREVPVSSYSENNPWKQSALPVTLKMCVLDVQLHSCTHAGCLPCALLIDSVPFSLRYVQRGVMAARSHCTRFQGRTQGGWVFLLSCSFRSWSSPLNKDHNLFISSYVILCSLPLQALTILSLPSPFYPTRWQQSLALRSPPGAALSFVLSYTPAPWCQW